MREEKKELQNAINSKTVPNAAARDNLILDSLHSCSHRPFSDTPRECQLKLKLCLALITSQSRDQEPFMSRQRARSVLQLYRLAPAN
jgi:hypothetical protein